MAGKRQGRIRVGILGQGRSGWGIHAVGLAQAPRKYQVAAVSDILKDRRERTEQEFGCDAYAEYRDLLARDDVELVINALPSHLHPEATIEVLKDHVGGPAPKGFGFGDVVPNSGGMALLG